MSNGLEAPAAGEMNEELLARYAQLVVELGANVQEDQIVRVRAFTGQEDAVRAIAAAAYRRGARFVDAWYFDPHLKRVRLLHAREETLDFIPSWYGETLLAASEQRCAQIVFTGPIAPGLYDDLDPVRVARDRLPLLKEGPEVVNARTMNMCVAPWPNTAWARLVYPGLDGGESLRRLTSELVHVLRLDEPDPIAAWEERLEALRVVCERLNERHFDALRLVGNGTELTVGLFQGSRWVTGDDVSAAGIRFVRNLPTEEVFTAPDPARVDGVVRATRPFWFAASQAAVEELTVRFEGGRAVAVDAASGAEALRVWLETDEGASRVGEIALVDDSSRIGPLHTSFYDTLIDENAGSHMAFGLAPAFTLDDDARPHGNRSSVHNDFVIGSDDLVVTGITRDGDELPIMTYGHWQL